MNPEIWGGVECTVNRVGSRYFNQLERNGHSRRFADLAAIAGLGLKTLRYPVLWETVQPHSSDLFDWAWTDERLGGLRHLGIRPIVGLLHHGSGPLWTNLLEPDFPGRFADYALAVAKRFPWVDAYTPVNEPLTTARFSALYGHWYPHRKDDESFSIALANQVEGTIRAMEAIRSIQPRAILVQTEDMGKVFSTPLLKYQADFENERRWLTFDLLNGRFTESHPLWKFIVRTDVMRSRCDYIYEHAHAPDIYGINYYVTSERFLDENLDNHRVETYGGNGFHSYADIEAVRARPEGMMGLGPILRETWARYGGPLAVTEAHLGCTREEQLRWLMDVWHTGLDLTQQGINLRAVTAWALLGAFDWSGLVTHEGGSYEPGAFDTRSSRPRPTALASAIRSLNRTGNFRHPLLQTKGWWSRGERDLSVESAADSHAEPHEAPILILGGNGSVGQALGRICQSRGLVHRTLSRHQADICDPASLARAVGKYQPWAIINAAGYTLVDEAEFDAERCFDVNARGAANVARICDKQGIACVTFSSDLVFDGSKDHPYVESDAPQPINVFGASKKEAEERVLQLHSDALVIRAGALFGPWNDCHFAAEALRSHGELIVPAAEISPTYIPDLCHALLDLLVDGESGIWHLANGGAVSWAEFAHLLCRRFDVASPQLRMVDGDAYPAHRPAQSVLQSERGQIMPRLEDALNRFHDEFLPLFGQHPELAHAAR
jgi:dTDP-4-dehydrorhamnose reductase